MSEVEEQQEDCMFQIKIGGTPFLLTKADVHSLGSEVIANLVALEPPKGVGIYTLDRVDPECFSALLSMVRFGCLSTSVITDTKKENCLLELVRYLCMDEKMVEQQLTNEKEKVKPDRFALNRLVEKRIELNNSSRHHNHREDDGAGRIYCVDCGNRDIDSRWYPRCHQGCLSYGHEDYTSCKKCGTMVKYKPELNWCHKCSLCKGCQWDINNCPADNHCSAGYYSQKTTAELEKEAEALMKTLAK